MNSYVCSGCGDSLVSLYRQACIYFCTQHTFAYMCAQQQTLARTVGFVSPAEEDRLLLLLLLLLFSKLTAPHHQHQPLAAKCEDFHTTSTLQEYLDIKESMFPGY